MRKLYVLILVALVAAVVLPMSAMADAGDVPAYIHGRVWDTTNASGIGNATVDLYYEVSTIVGEDR